MSLRCNHTPSTLFHDVLSSAVYFPSRPAISSTHTCNRWRPAEWSFFTCRDTTRWRVTSTGCPLSERCVPLNTFYSVLHVSYSTQSTLPASSEHLFFTSSTLSQPLSMNTLCICTSLQWCEGARFVFIICVKSNFFARGSPKEQ